MIHIQNSETISNGKYRLNKKKETTSIHRIKVAPILYLLEYSAYGNNRTIVCRRSVFNAVCRIACMDNCVSACIDGYMPVIAYDIAWLHTAVAYAVARASERA